MKSSLNRRTPGRTNIPTDSLVGVRAGLGCADTAHVNCYVQSRPAYPVYAASEAVSPCVLQPPPDSSLSLTAHSSHDHGSRAVGKYHYPTISLSPNLPGPTEFNCYLSCFLVEQKLFWLCSGL
jgi:hypothetical protein